MHDFGECAIYHFSDINIEQLANGDKTECRLGLIFTNWYIVKLYWYVTLRSACIIIIVANCINHMGIKTISCSWGVDDVTMTSDYSNLL